MWKGCATLFSVTSCVFPAVFKRKTLQRWRGERVWKDGRALSSAAIIVLLSPSPTNAGGRSEWNRSRPCSCKTRFFLYLFLVTE